VTSVQVPTIEIDSYKLLKPRGPQFVIFGCSRIQDLEIPRFLSRFQDSRFGKILSSKDLVTYQRSYEALTDTVHQG